MTLPDARVNKNLQGPGLRAQVQRIGGYLAGMIMPNIGAFIAWGLITALFIKTGWLPNATFAQLVDPMLYYLLPLLIGYTGGRMVHAQRGAVIGAIASAGVIIGGLPNVPEFTGGTPMFLGAMIMGPLAAFILKLFDKAVDGKIPSGFEMLVDNFSLGIIGLLLVLVGVVGVGPILAVIVGFLGAGVQILVNAGLLPLASIFVEPAKVLFLNNAINHGIFTPLAAIDVQTAGKSILFMVESNPGAGLGLLLAFMFFGPKSLRPATPGAIIIHFFGGIHEIYFPYVLAKPRLILAMILGGMTGVFVNVAMGNGLVGPAAPGSIFAVMTVTARGDHFGVALAVATSALVTLVVAAFLLKLDNSDDDGDLSAATASMEEMKGKKSIASTALAGAGTSSATPGRAVRSIVFACDAGMGSSAMGASVLRRKVQAAGFSDVTVVNKAIANLSDDVDLLVTHQDLASRAGQRSPSAALYTVDNFMASPVYDEIVEHLRVSNVPAAVGATAAGAAGTAAVTDAVPPASAVAAPSGLLSKDSIRLVGTATSRDEAITEAGELLVAAGAVDASYVAAMHERERSVSTFMGNGLAIPHGTNEAKGSIARSAVSFVRYSDGVDWNGKQATFVVAIAGQGDDHLSILSNLSKVFLDKSQIAALEAATTPEQVLEILGAVSA